MTTEALDINYCSFYTVLQGRMSDQSTWQILQIST